MVLEHGPGPPARPPVVVGLAHPLCVTHPRRGEVSVLGGTARLLDRLLNLVDGLLGNAVELLHDLLPLGSDEIALLRRGR